MSKLKHIYWAIRHGDWDCGWERAPGDPWFSFHHGYYDCHWGYVCLGWFWVGVSY